MYCDLHTHSIFSDGSLRPEQIIAQAKERGLTVALTDHNTVSGLRDFMAAANAQGIRAIPGIEFSTTCHGQELHLVGLFIEPEHYDRLESVAEEFQRLKEQSNREMIRRLNTAGYAIDYDEIRSRSPGGNINRAHMGKALVRQGYVRSVQEAFETLLGEDLPFYVPCRRLETTEAIRILREIQAVPILAHPLQDLSEAELRQILPELMGAGLIAMETHHSSYDDATIALASRIAGEFHLLPSGGSDFHGTAKPDIHLGVGKGNLHIPLSVLENLEAARRQL